MPKTLIIFLFVILPNILLGESRQYDASMNIELDDVRPFIVQLNKQLGLKLNAKVLSDYAKSIAVGNDFSESLDVHYRGTVLTITYEIRKKHPESTKFYFFSYNRYLIDDIRLQMKSFPKIVENDT